MHSFAPEGEGRHASCGSLLEFSSAPPQTRMLLYADSSTTVLLEALVVDRLKVQVEQQILVRADDFPDIGCGLLGAAPSAMVVDRKSRILTADHDVISVNRVIIAGPDRDSLVPADGELLGPHLRNIGLVMQRKPLAAARDIWPVDGMECGSKTYVIDCRPAGRVYVHERFNPQFIPL
ncbi:hypothetical protein ERC79_21295 [Rhodococcus sp. ABRD24]|uniref:hypothetical protein n=1 Tax=Rhodococcus sp. ABRD24 TaxID=2507582 RepID=UPI00103E7783|nr:hypothetical protein [Rhodococcus sp. ABRD24]QBJ98193.1 hypothetical protein ERC79_21295 [Rhodococcus sp. ABRD24]